jgi:hypothetical protein
MTVGINFCDGIVNCILIDFSLVEEKNDVLGFPSLDRHERFGRLFK